MKVIEELCRNKGIFLLQVTTRKVKAMALLLDNHHFIAYDPSKFLTEKALEEALLHEYYHIVTATLHSMNDASIVDINEDVANIYTEAYGTSRNLY